MKDNRPITFLMFKAIPFPKAGQRIEFESDRFTDKGPASGEIAEVKTTVDGIYIVAKISDGQATLSWDDMSQYAKRDGDLWIIKSHPMVYPGPRSQAQADAGNYRKRKLVFQGIPIRIENEAGTVRRGQNRKTGAAWAQWMLYPYGYVMRSEGTDGDEVDVTVGPNPDAPMAFIVRARHSGDWKNYDEDKCYVGFDSEADVKFVFLACYSDPRFLGPIVSMPIEEFRAKVKATYDNPGMVKSQFMLFRKD